MMLSLTLLTHGTITILAQGKLFFVLETMETNMILYKKINKAVQTFFKEILAEV